MDDTARRIRHAELASLLDVDATLARRALERCGYDLEVAVGIAVDLLAAGRSEAHSSSSSGGAVAAAAGHGRWRLEIEDEDEGDEDDDDLMHRFGDDNAFSDDSMDDRDFGQGFQVQAMAQRYVRRPHKRPKTEKSFLFPLPANIKLKNNAEDIPAENPPLFKAHPLREEQCRSLAWMLAQEAKKNGLRGGLLADKMGYGKTATSIGLISLGRPGTVDRCPRGYLAAKGTLVICPPRLLQQWEDEFVKFLGDSLSIWHSGVGGPEPVKKKAKGDNGKLKLLVLTGHKQYKTTKRFGNKLPVGISIDDFSAKFDIILASSAIQAGGSYCKKSIDVACSVGKQQPAGLLMSKRTELLRDVLTHKRSEVLRKFSGCDENTFPAFEMFWWHRIILDEFHESDSWQFRVREMMKSIGGTHRWGLSGTPPMGSCDSVTEVAELLWFPKLEKAPNMESFCQLKGKSEHKRLDAVTAPKLGKEVTRFLSEFVRQNVSEVVEAIAVEEHLELVHHVAEERLIYRQACHDHGIFDLEQDYDGASLAAREALLRRCAHFSLVGGADSAKSAVQHLGTAKQERIAAVQKQLCIELQRATLLGVGAEARKLPAPAEFHPDAAAFLAEVASMDISSLAARSGQDGFDMDIEYYTADGELRMHPEVKLQQPLPDAECYDTPQQRHAVLHELARHRNKAASQILGRMQMCEQACRGSRGMAAQTPQLSAVSNVIRMLDAAHKSLQFYEAQLRGLSQAVEEECAICLESMSEVRAVALLPCSHMFHTACVRAVLQQQQRCPHCNSKVEVRQLASAVMELQAPQETSTSSASSSQRIKDLSPALRAHGSKLNAIAERLRQIRRDDNTARAIVFVQWLELENLVAKALQAHEVPFVRPQGAASLGDELRCFQNGDGPWVLILSLERAASGLHLTAANHVLFVHPMNAATLSTAKDYEQQAIGRVRRVGQARSSVHVWRFVTANTVEEHISNLHSRGAVENQ
eukprot:TRINITY_DN34167_c0_g1_i1.p1 TRINITY_DN34167_c0_g1~~TRINITY_DN34167_c0_g1_i1.p1  ORF type:complete len:995 (-),score=165.18 TRINITY_DN34167_c0_g1_i1:327-3272(-)